VLDSAYQLDPAACPDAALDDRTATGRQRPWRAKRLRTEVVAQGWALAGQPDQARRCQDCGTWLSFAECLRDGAKYLLKANFCGQRLCPLCAWRRSMKLSAEVSAVLHLAAETWPQRPYLLLTLTQRNVPGQDLPDEVSRILDGWSRLQRRREFREVSGWLRTLEVTYNAEAGEWHPHLHVLLQAKPSYFGRGYISHAKWVAAWRAVLNLDYDPSVEVHRVRQRASGDPLAAAAAEVGKYTVKDTDLTGDTPQEASERLVVLDRALAGRRLVAWGGDLRQLARQVEEAEDEDDLVHIAGEDHGDHCPVCGSDLAEVIYRWSRPSQAYLRTFTRQPQVAAR